MGFIVKFEPFRRVKEVQLLEEIGLSSARIALWSTSNWIVAYYPYFSWLHQLSLTVGLLRSAKIARIRGCIYGVPMQVFPGSATEFSAETDGMLTFVFGPRVEDHSHASSSVDCDK